MQTAPHKTVTPRYTTRYPEARTRNQEVTQNQPSSALSSTESFRLSRPTAHRPPGMTSSLRHLSALQELDEGRLLVSPRYTRGGLRATMKNIGNTPVPRETSIPLPCPCHSGTWRLLSECTGYPKKIFRLETCVTLLFLNRFRAYMTHFEDL